MVSAAVAAVTVVASVANSNKQAKAAKNAAQMQANAAEDATGISQENFRQAKNTIEDNFRLANISQQLGTSAALAVNAELAPTQINAFQQGNIGAQNTLLAGLGAQNQALLGQPIDLSGLQSQQVEIDPSIFKVDPIDFTQAENESIAARQVKEAEFQDALSVELAAQQKLQQQQAQAKAEANKRSVLDKATDPLGIFGDKPFGGLF